LHPDIPQAPIRSRAFSVIPGAPATGLLPVRSLAQDYDKTAEDLKGCAKEVRHPELFVE
jgi:hypothetical protein